MYVLYQSCQCLAYRSTARDVTKHYGFSQTRLDGSRRPYVVLLASKFTRCISTQYFTKKRCRYLDMSAVAAPIIEAPVGFGCGAISGLAQRRSLVLCFRRVRGAIALAPVQGCQKLSG
jgi:hypothetical protein